MKMWLKQEELDVAFLVEADSNIIKTAEDYKIEEYETVLPNIHEENKVRIIALRKNNASVDICARKDLMSPDFPSIWMEAKIENKKSILIGGFYREWTQVGSRTDHEQCRILETLTDQMTKANTEGKRVVMLGDANLDSLKWENKEYTHNKVAKEMQNALASNGMVNMDVGNTFLADRLRLDGTKIESALDHVYIQKEMEADIKVTKGESSATDHLPIMAEISQVGKTKDKRKVEPKSIVKRSMKNFSEENWKSCLLQQDWEKLGRTEDVHEMADMFDENISKALDECVPFKKIIIRHSYRC